MPARDVNQIWTDYYEQFPIPPWVVTKLLTTAMRMLTRSGLMPLAPSVAEIGGGNSHVAPWFLAAWPQTVRYTALDINALGLATVPPGVAPLWCDILADDLPPLAASVVVSTGVIQHFQQADTARAIRAHFTLAQPGGLVLLTFPRDTPIYWVCRSLFTWLGLFPRDLYERPLTARELLAAVEGHGRLVDATTVWSIGFAHTFMLFTAESTTTSMHKET